MAEGTKLLKAGPSESRLTLMRNTSLGAAGVALVLILALLDREKRSTFDAYALIAVCAAMPLWFAAGTILEFYIFTGAKSYGHYAVSQFAVGGLQVVGGIALLGAIGIQVFEASPDAGWAFVIAIVVALVIVGIVGDHLEKWMKKRRAND